MVTIKQIDDFTKKVAINNTHSTMIQVTPEFYIELCKLLNESKKELLYDIEKLELQYWNKCKKFDKNCEACLYWKKFDKIKNKYKIYKTLRK